MVTLHSSKQKTMKKSRKTNGLCASHINILKSVCLKACLWLVQPFFVFARKQWYKLVACDASFVVSLVVLGLFVDAFVLRQVPTITQSFLIAGSILFIVLMLYGISKFIFHHIRGDGLSFWSILWRHSTAFLLIAIPLGIVVSILYAYIGKIVIEEHIERAKLLVRYAYVFVVYLTFITFQAHDVQQRNLLRAVARGFTNMFHSIIRIMYINAVLVLSAYALYNVFAYLLRVYYQLFGTDPLTLHTFFEQTSPAIMVIIIILILAMNKAIVFDAVSARRGVHEGRPAS